MGVDNPKRAEVFRRLVDIASEQVSLVPIMTRSNVYAYKPGCISNLEAYLPGGADRFNDVRVGAKCK